MNNHVTASVEFYFKGEKLSVSIELALDQYMMDAGCLPDVYVLLAQAMGIGFYTYEYEMLLSETICFSNAEGLAKEYTSDGSFKNEAFEAAWRRNHILEQLQEIAQRNLSLTEPDLQEGLEKALLEAYQLGAGTENI